MLNYRKGFVYIWFDKKHKRYYIGSHLGTTTDGYICSSRWMKISYKRRPQDFKRRIIFKSDSILYKDLLFEEYKWLSLIKEEELGKKYYNITNHHPNHWAAGENIDEIKKKTTSKINKPMSEEQKQKISKTMKKRGIRPNLNEEQMKKCIEARKGRKSWSKGLTKEIDPRLIQIGITRKENDKLQNKTYISWNKGLTKETNNIILKSSIKANETKKDKVYIPWNKGLTKNSDKRVCSGNNHPSINNIKLECPFCKKIGPKPNMIQWHFENCKNRKT